jgi:predicted ribosome-associated RNA-binding protein Tma20
MTDEYYQLLRDLQQRVEQLKSLYELELSKNQSLELELEKNKKELMYTHKKMLELQAKHDNLVTVGLLSITEDERKQAKYRLTKMVREIDKCLALLNQ